MSPRGGAAGSWARRLFCGALPLLIAVSAWAADDSKVIYPGGATAKPTMPSAGAGSSFSTVTLFLAVVLAAAGGWVMWRNRRNQVGARVGGRLAVEETKSLGNRQYLVVASYEGRKFLLGVCPGRIDMLSPLERDEAEEPLP